jgi:hypothetical protein
MSFCGQYFLDKPRTLTGSEPFFTFDYGSFSVLLLENYRNHLPYY